MANVLVMEKMNLKYETNKMVRYDCNKRLPDIRNIYIRKSSFDDDKFPATIMVAIYEGE